MIAGDFNDSVPTAFELQNGYPLEHGEYTRRLDSSIQELTEIADYPGWQNERESNEQFPLRGR